MGGPVHGAGSAGQQKNLLEVIVAGSRELEVAADLARLVQAIEATVALVGEEAASASQRQAFERAREILRIAEEIAAVRRRLEELRDRWKALPDHSLPAKQERPVSREVGTGLERTARRAGAPRSPLPQGQKTRQQAFYVPILEALESMGGRATSREVLAEVERRMAPRLTPVDYEKMKTYPHPPRWHKTANWARYDMVRAGLLESNSPTGIWEISARGREYLRRAKSSPGGGA